MRNFVIGHRRCTPLLLFLLEKVVLPIKTQPLSGPTKHDPENVKMDRDQDETEQHIVRSLHRSLAPVELGINGVVIHSILLTFLTIVKGIAGPIPTFKTHSPRAVEGNDCPKNTRASLGAEFG
jgi:hypothetical protein